MIEIQSTDGEFNVLHCTKCNIVSARTRATAEQFHHKCGKQSAPEDDGIPCDYRGEAVDRVKCGCSGTQHTWRCNNPAVESGLCILRYMPKMPKEFKDWPTCNSCDLRRADG